MDTDNAVEFEHVSKIYGEHQSISIKDRIVYHKKKKEQGRTVLNDVSFSVKKGEAIGIIGSNGSGKSTILKLITKIVNPNKGTITVNASRVSCLIELGAGFHPDMSGLENIYINASIFGLDNASVNEKIRQIIEFSGIEDHINERVRDYSSGMYMRLAFSIAINVDADLLVIDEILSVGDIAFQKKCLEKIKELKNSGVTIIFVTQFPEQAKLICDNVIWLDKGEIRMMGECNEVCDRYTEYMIGDSSD